MPNDCCNTLIVSESTLPVIIDNYIRKDERGNDFFDFERIVPIGDSPDWYGRRLEKWGTTEAGYDVQIGKSSVDFYTAWSPPVQIIKKLAELHPGPVFRLEYYEPGNDFRGIAAAYWKDGEVFLEDQCWDMTEEDYEELGLV